MIPTNVYKHHEMRLMVVKNNPHSRLLMCMAAKVPIKIKKTPIPHRNTHI